MSEVNNFRDIKNIVFNEITQMRLNDVNGAAIMFPRVLEMLNLRLDIITVQNTLNPDVFSVIIRFQNLLLRNHDESGQVDILIVIPQYNQNILISPNLINVNAFDSYRGNDIENFVARIPELVVRLWNENS
ncbi:MAG: hypothetical protein R2685_04005 [Candidatus Nitrosocosmicus sp.]|nr:hypothetical protein [Candidatus Nitrosocosmicus sp.]